MSYLEYEITSDNSTLCASTAYVQSNLANYLPLSGGTITGQLRLVYANNSAQLGCNASTDYGGLYIEAKDANNGSNGARLVLRPAHVTKETGNFNIRANDGTNRIDLTGQPNGSLTWGGVSVLNPVGTVIAFAANSAPSGYLLCNGGAVSRTTYATLFSVIGTTYGEGDGSTTFNLPNLTDKFIQGSGTAGTVKSAGLPNITALGALIGNGTFGHHFGTRSGAFYNGANSSYRLDGAYNASGTAKQIGFNASLSNSIYGNSSTVQPPALTMRYYIKY